MSRALHDASRSHAFGVTMRQMVARRIVGAITALTLIAMPIWVSAHHSSATFDSSRAATLQGVVKEFRWTNPHAILPLSSKPQLGRSLRLDTTLFCR
jgi:hypothetical protein